MSLDKNDILNYDNFELVQNKIHEEEVVLYNKKISKTESEVGLGYDNENLFPYRKKVASDFVSNVAYRCLALDIASVQESNLVLIDPDDAIDLFLKENFDITFSEAKFLSDGQKKHIIVENIEHKAWLLYKEGFFERQAEHDVYIEAIFQYLNKKFSAES